MKAEIPKKSKQINIPSIYKPLKEILKEKILYDHICNIHHTNFIKFCSICKKDICISCKEELH